jgi:C4-dicarboxylate-specific signal transduction histidine kinase
LRNADDAMPMTGVRAIRIAARAVGDMVDITVSDSGPGFSPDVLASLEYGVDSSKGPDRMGFGLAICRRIVERWGGRISWGNLPEGGARIALTVPMARD